jgi:hypothetical protein
VERVPKWTQGFEVFCLRQRPPGGISVRKFSGISQIEEVFHSKVQVPKELLAEIREQRSYENNFPLFGAAMPISLQVW